MRVNFGNMHKLHELYVHNRKTPVAIFFSNGCVAVTIDFICYLYEFSLNHISSKQTISFSFNWQFLNRIMINY